jgi:hypothetical protein
MKMETEKSELKKYKEWVDAIDSGKLFLDLEKLRLKLEKSRPSPTIVDKKEILNKVMKSPHEKYQEHIKKTWGEISDFRLYNMVEGEMDNLLHIVYEDEDYFKYLNKDAEFFKTIDRYRFIRKELLRRKKDVSNYDCNVKDYTSHLKSIEISVPKSFEVPEKFLENELNGKEGK